MILLPTHNQAHISSPSCFIFSSMTMLARNSRSTQSLLSVFFHGLKISKSQNYSSCLSNFFTSDSCTDSPAIFQRIQRLAWIYSATSLPPSSLLISERQLAMREDQIVTSILILRRARQASKHCEYLVVPSWWSRWRAKQRRICEPGRQLMKAWKFYSTAAPGGWFTLRLNSEQGRSRSVPSRFRRSEWQQNSWQVLLMMPARTSAPLTTPCVLERRKMRKRKRLKSSYLQALMLSEQETVRRAYRITVATQSSTPLFLGQRNQKVSLAEWSVSPSTVASSTMLKRKSAATQAHESPTMRHSLCSNTTAHLGNSLFRGCKKQMLTLTVLSANISRGRSRSDAQASAINFIKVCSQILHCPQLPSTAQYSNWQYPLSCSIQRARTLSRLVSRKVASAKRVQMGESCLMGKRRECRWMLAKTKPDRHICAPRQTAYGHPETQSCFRKESNPILIIIYPHPTTHHRGGQLGVMHMRGNRSYGQQVCKYICQDHIIMSNKQRLPEEKAGKLKQIDKAEYSRYTKHMIQHDFPAFTIFASYVEKWKTVLNTECILVVCKTTTKTMLGYAKMIYSKHPLVRRMEDIQKKIDLENIFSVYIVDENKLNLKYNLPLTGEIKELTFEFLSKTLLQHWVSFIHEQNAILRGSTVNEANRDRQRLVSLGQQLKTILALYDDLKRISSQGDAKFQSLLVKQKQMQAEMNQMRGAEGKAKQLEEQREQLVEEREQLLKELDVVFTSKQKKEEECNQLIKQIQAFREAQQRHDQEIKQLKQQFKSSQTEVQSIRRQLGDREPLERVLFQQNKSANQKLKLFYQAKIASLKEELKYKEEKLGQQIYYARQQEQTVANLQATIQEHKNTINSLSARCQEQSSTINQSTQREEELQRQLQHCSAQLLQKQQEEILLRLQALFVGEALQDYQHHKLFLKETLQTHRQLTIRRTKLLFRFDPLNKANFHQYIDHHPDLLLIVKTAEGAFLAGYTQSPITPSNAADRPGVIISLTNQLSFQLQEDRRCVSYDEYYIIFGNSEIRLKSLELTVFSNFGISNGFFLNRGLGVEALLCNPNREVPIETFELHQVYFSQ